MRYAGKKMGEETAKKVIKYINQKTKTELAYDIFSEVISVLKKGKNE